MKCPNCGGPRDQDDRFCVYCKTKFDVVRPAPDKQEIHIHYHQENRPEPRMRVEHIEVPREKRSTRSRTIALLLCLFLGMLGVHRFYLGKIGTGVLYLLTYGLFSAGWLIDLCILIFGNPRDKEGYLVTWH